MVRLVLVKGKLKSFPDRPPNDKGRDRQDRFRGTRLFCPECVDQGSFEPRFARPEVWCESFCWKHAREKGLKPPPSRAGKNKKPRVGRTPRRVGRTPQPCTLGGTSLPCRDDPPAMLLATPVCRAGHMERNRVGIWGQPS